MEFGWRDSSGSYGLHCDKTGDLVDNIRFERTKADLYTLDENSTNMPEDSASAASTPLGATAPSGSIPPTASVSAPNGGTATATATATMTTTGTARGQPEVLRLTLRGRSNVRWDESVVDNEGMGRRSSKRCCIFHKQRAFGESSTDSSDEEGGHGHNHRKIARPKKKVPDFQRFHA